MERSWTALSSAVHYCHVMAQGDTDATRFYVLEAGTCEVFIKDVDAADQRHVHTYKPGRSDVS